MTLYRSCQKRHCALHLLGQDPAEVAYLQVHPTAFVDPQEPTAHSKILAPEALRGHGAILVDGAGKRFVNELATRDVVTAAMKSTRGPVYLILPQVSIRFESPRHTIIL